jgi:cell division septation protein DedD
MKANERPELPESARDFQGGLAAAKRGDNTEAEKWSRKAAKGKADTLITLGLMRANGHGVPQDYQKGLAAYNRGDYATALREWESLAAKGKADAQITLGLMRANGHGVPQDYQKGLAAYNRGDYATALREWKSLAAKGKANVQKKLSVIHGNGKGLPPESAYEEVMKELSRIKAPPMTPKIKTKAEKTPIKVTNGSKNPNTPGAIIAALPPAPARANFRIQLGAIKSMAGAVDEAVRLTHAHKSILNGLKLVLVRADLGTRGVFYRLRVGPLNSRATANSLCRKLSARKQGCIVIKP